MLEHYSLREWTSDIVNAGRAMRKHLAPIPTLMIDRPGAPWVGLLLGFALFVAGKRHCDSQRRLDCWVIEDPEPFGAHAAGFIAWMASTSVFIASLLRSRYPSNARAVDYTCDSIYGSLLPRFGFRLAYPLTQIAHASFPSIPIVNRHRCCSVVVALGRRTQHGYQGELARH